jgi:hypothetical protein
MGQFRRGLKLRPNQIWMLSSFEKIPFRDDETNFLTWISQKQHVWFESFKMPGTLGLFFPDSNHPRSTKNVRAMPVDVQTAIPDAEPPAFIEG